MKFNINDIPEDILEEIKEIAANQGECIDITDKEDIETYVISDEEAYEMLLPWIE